jgi:hypothetical protein
MGEVSTKQVTMEKGLGIVRHILTFAGGLIVMKGLADESLIQELSGALLSLVGGIWSILAKNKK